MNRQDRKNWQDKNERLNAGVELRRGMVVSDGESCHGVVVKIIPNDPANPIEDHGTIYIWQDQRNSYGADNCEHYAFTDWQRHLRIEEP